MILDWPFDIILIEGDSEEEVEVNAFKWSVNLGARVERLRDFVGLDNMNLLRIVAKAAQLVQAATAAHKKASTEEIQEWLQENVKWGLLHCPDVKTVQRHLDNWNALQESPSAMNLIEAALNRWGRDNLLDWPTKLGLIVQKTDDSSLGFVVETLYTKMWRMKLKDPIVCKDLGHAVEQILWVKNYQANFMRNYPAVFNTGCNSEQQLKPAELVIIERAKSYLHPP